MSTARLSLAAMFALGTTHFACSGEDPEGFVTSSTDAGAIGTVAPLPSSDKHVLSDERKFQDMWSREAKLFPERGLFRPLSGVSTQFSKVVVFGDSLSDVGNVLGMSRGLVPTQHGYWQGRFSNGPVWLEYLVDMVKREASTYAYGAALVYDTKLFGPPDMGTQVKTYLNDDNWFLGTPADIGESLFVLWGGHNDYFQGHHTYSNILRIVGELQYLAQKLIDRGARYMLVPSLADIADTPSQPPYQAGSLFATWPGYNLGALEDMSEEDLDAYYRQVIDTHNMYLQDAILHLQRKNPAVTIVTLNSADIFSRVMENGADFGLRNVDSACYEGSILAGREDAEQSRCDAPNSHVFYDTAHPTSRIHCILALSVAATLQNESLLSAAFDLDGHNDRQTLVNDCIAASPSGQWGSPEALE